MITGKVAQILSDTQIVINVGRNQGVKEKMKFVIYSTGDHIIDPDTGEDLGVLELVKDRVVVYHVQENISSAISEMETIESFSTNLSIVRSMFVQPHSQRKKLNVREDQIKPQADDLHIKKGDLVRSIEVSGS